MRIDFAVVTMPPLPTRGAAGKYQHLVRRGIAGGVGPGLHVLIGLLAIGISDIALLGDGVDAALGKKGGVD